MSESEHSLAERHALLNKLLDSVKQCQIRFGGRTELATDGDSRVICLCTHFEVVLQHGLRNNNKGLAAFKHVTEMVTGINLRNVEDEPVFWHVIKNVLTKHEYERYLLLKNITTDAGRGRAWLRSALNEHALERYIHMLLGDPTLLSQHYEDWAFIVDQERSSMLPMMAAGLGSILFAINIDNPDLNVVRVHPVTNSSVLSAFHTSVASIPTPVVASPPKGDNLKKQKKKKKTLAQIVSFDDDDITGNSRCIQLSPSYFSAPPTCLSSPIDSESDPATSNPHEMHSSQIETCLKDYSEVNNDDCEEKIEPNTDVDRWNSSYLATTTMVDSTLASSSDQDCSGSCEELQYSEEGSHGSGVVIASVDIQSVQTSVTDLQENNKTCNDSENTQKVKKSLIFDDKKSTSPSKYNSQATILTPINDLTIGELIPITNFEEVNSDDIHFAPQITEDSVSLPSYSEDTECASAALALQKVLQNCTSSEIQLIADKNSTNMIPKDNKSDGLPCGDMKQAIIALMQKKDEIEEQNKSLRNLLDREMEMCSGLRIEMEDIKQKNQDKYERLQTKLQALVRENELLKHQLRKYVGAVQMLKKDGPRNDGDPVPVIPEPKPYIDYHLEATEYERKLIQVAEMHGELMEFNERLHRLLSQKETVVRRLREELIDLRGPLPDDNQISDDDISVTSDYDASSMTAATRSLINIWIPSAFLAGKSSDSHHVYQVYIRIRDDEWNIYRRYAQFYALHKVLKKKNPIVSTFDFPPKKAIGNKDAKFVEERRKRLQHYLRCVVNVFIQSCTELNTNPDKESFIKILPFFGEFLGSADGNRRHRSRNLFSRNPGDQSANDSAFNHYTGL